jgi:hypothetical protein
MVRNPSTAELHAGVDFLAQDLELEFQVEVAILAIGTKKLVVSDRRRQRAADDRAVFDAKDLFVPCLGTNGRRTAIAPAPPLWQRFRNELRRGFR